MRRALMMVATLAVALLIPVAPTLAQTESAAVVTVNATTAGGSLELGENILFHEAWITEEKLPTGVVVGPHPIYFNDGGYGNTSCSFGQAAIQAQSDGVDDWIVMIERAKCPGAYQQSVSSAESAGAAGLIIGNSEANAGAPVQPAAEGASMVAGMVDYDDAQRILETRLGASDPIEVRITLRFLTFEVEEDLPPRPKGYRPPESSGSGEFGTFDDDRFGDFASGEFGQGVEGAESAPDTEIITVPGPDGELVEIEVPVYAQDVAEEGGFNPLIPVTVSLIVLGATLGFLFFIRPRRNGRTT